MSSVIFKAELHDIRQIKNVLKAVTFHDFAIVSALEHGLKLSSDDDRRGQISAYIPKDIFHSYRIAEDEIRFKINFKALADVFDSFGDEGNPVTKLSYKGEGEPLVIFLQHDVENIYIENELSTFDGVEEANVQLDETSTVNNIVVNAPALYEVLSKIENSSDEIEFILSPEPPHFKINQKTSQGTSTICIPKASPIFILFRCGSLTTAMYPSTPFKQILKVIKLADKVSMSIGDTGLLRFQIIIKTHDQGNIYVEYYINPLVDIL